MSDGPGDPEKQLNGYGEQGKARSRTSLVILQSVNRSIFTSAVSPAAERIRFILGEDDDSPAPPQLFTELDELLAVDGQEMEWKETASFGMATASSEES
ncbi:UNVERIFIED_CONTAM: Electrogenic sodium bicarbonate cotransporter 1 [Gekko kuhli]